MVESLAIVSPFYPPSVGGVERFSRAFAREAAARGVRVNVVTTAAVRTPQIAVEDEGINVLRLPAWYVPVAGSSFPIPRAGMRALGEYLDCDIVLAQTRFYLTTLLAAAIASRRGRRICVLDHGSGPLRSGSAFAAASLAYERAVTAALKRFSPDFFGVSAASVAWLEHFGIRGAGELPNGISPRAQMPARSAAPGSKTVVFFAGRLLPEKGVRELVEGVERLAAAGLDIELRIAGEGPLAAWLVQRAATHPFLTALGRLEAAGVAAEMERATLFVNPSNYAEGLPTILLEAGCAALGVVSTPRGGGGELVRDGETGWLIPLGEASSIATALEDAIARPQEAIRRGAALFALVQSRYTWPAIVGSFLDRFDVRTKDE
jgi:glycosyltransferase involved in cell wall biosynthesis